MGSFHRRYTMDELLAMDLTRVEKVMQSGAMFDAWMEDNRLGKYIAASHDCGWDDLDLIHTEATESDGDLLEEWVTTCKFKAADIARLKRAIPDIPEWGEAKLEEAIAKKDKISAAAAKKKAAEEKKKAAALKKKHTWTVKVKAAHIYSDKA